MRLEESGSFTVDAAPEEALSYLADAETLPGCLPGEVHDVTPRDDGGVSVEMTARFAGASEDVRVRLYVEDVDRDAGHVSYTGHGLGSRAKVDLDGAFDVVDSDGGARVEWRGAADVGGLLSSLNRGVAVTAVGEKLAETADNVRVELESLAD